MSYFQDFDDPNRTVILRRSDYDWLLEIKTKLENRFKQPIRINGPVLDSKLLCIWFEIQLNSDDAFWWSSISYERPSTLLQLKRHFTIRSEKSVDEIVEEISEQFNRGFRLYERLPY